MLWRIWAGVGAVTIGIALATVLGGGTPPWAGAVFLVALVLGGGVTLLALRKRGRGPGRSQGMPSPSEELANYARDRELVRHLHGMIGASEITWLRDANFDTPWRDAHIAAFRELAATEIGYVAFDFELRDAAGRLMTATRAFLQLYDRTTIEDPMMLDATWRMVGDPTDPAGEMHADRSQRDSYVQLLGQAATEICESYDELSAAGRYKFGIALD